MDWQFVVASALRALLGIAALIVQFRMFRTSRSGVIRNFDSALLLATAFAHSLFWIAISGLPLAAALFSNAAFLLVAFFVAMRLL